MIVGARGQTDFSLLVLFPSYVERRRRRRRRPIHSPRRQLRRGDALRMSRRRIPAKTIRKKKGGAARAKLDRPATSLPFDPSSFFCNNFFLPCQYAISPRQFALTESEMFARRNFKLFENFDDSLQFVFFFFRKLLARNRLK